MERDADVGIVTVDFGKGESRSRLPQAESPVHLVADVRILHVPRLGSFAQTITNKDNNKKRSSLWLGNSTFMPPRVFSVIVLWIFISATSSTDWQLFTSRLSCLRREISSNVSFFLLENKNYEQTCSRWPCWRKVRKCWPSLQKITSYKLAADG